MQGTGEYAARFHLCLRQGAGSLRGLKFVPSTWRCLVPGGRRDGAQSRPPWIEPVEITSTLEGAYPIRKNTLSDDNPSR